MHFAHAACTPWRRLAAGPDVEGGRECHCAALLHVKIGVAKAVNFGCPPWSTKAEALTKRTTIASAMAELPSEAESPASEGEPLREHQPPFFALAHQFFSALRAPQVHLRHRRKKMAGGRVRPGTMCLQRLLAVPTAATCLY